MPADLFEVVGLAERDQRVPRADHGGRGGVEEHGLAGGPGGAHPDHDQPQVPQDRRRSSLGRLSVPSDSVGVQLRPWSVDLNMYTCCAAGERTPGARHPNGRRKNMPGSRRRSLGRGKRFMRKRLLLPAALVHRDRRIGKRPGGVFLSGAGCFAGGV